MSIILLYIQFILNYCEKMYYILCTIACILLKWRQFEFNLITLIRNSRWIKLKKGINQFMQDRVHLYKNRYNKIFKLPQKYGCEISIITLSIIYILNLKYLNKRIFVILLQSSCFRHMCSLVKFTLLFPEK